MDTKKFEDNVGLVYYAYENNFKDYEYCKDDIIQEGMIGLWDATKDSGADGIFWGEAYKGIVQSMVGFLKNELEYERHCSDNAIDELCGEDIIGIVDKKNDKIEANELEDEMDRKLLKCKSEVKIFKGFNNFTNYRDFVLKKDSKRLWQRLSINEVNN